MKITYLELLGEKHPLCCSLTATAELEEAFGSLEQMAEALTRGGIRARMETVNQTLEILMRAGRVYVQAEGGALPEPLPCAPSDLMDVTDGEAIKAIFSTISGDTRREVETEPKKEGAAPGEP